MIIITEKYSYYEANCKFEGYTPTFKFCLPRTCVHCGETMTPEVINRSETYENRVAFLVRCSHCKEFFAISYELFNDSLGKKTSKMIEYEYSAHIKYDLPEELVDISPKFKKIYTQAQIAEAYKLDQIAGIGYRKALEFLIKDFLINIRGLKLEEVGHINLSQAVDKLETNLLVSAAKAATWVGNDETHYVRKHADKDVEDLKAFLKSVAHFIAYEFIALKGSEFIEENSSNKSN